MQYRLTARGKIVISVFFLVLLYGLFLSLPHTLSSPTPPDPPPSKEADFINRDYLHKAVLTIYFEPDQYELTEDSRRSLSIFINLVRIYNHFTISLKGHTATTTGQNSLTNMALSQKRAEAVKNYLLTHGITADRISLVASGNQEPAGSNKTPEGRALNRRVDIYLFQDLRPVGDH
ncbi:hypothetical protein DCMF_18855 [Candidatus Formimonas warabiya]|uniref:OmpA-like domain-containing protein n=2 Tax=Formimonas warabiya TaxID=1761012 RepID=A0A3G1KWF8_FORW1|nr:hypothetical protein DCMF_18855 [Candidatus Formimonas warabiya]